MIPRIICSQISNTRKGVESKIHQLNKARSVNNHASSFGTNRPCLWIKWLKTKSREASLCVSESRVAHPSWLGRFRICNLICMDTLDILTTTHTRLVLHKLKLWAFRLTIKEQRTGDDGHDMLCLFVIVYQVFGTSSYLHDLLCCKSDGAVTGFGL